MFKRNLYRLVVRSFYTKLFYGDVAVIYSSAVLQYISDERLI